MDELRRRREGNQPLLLFGAGELSPQQDEGGAQPLAPSFERVLGDLRNKGGVAV